MAWWHILVFASLVLQNEVDCQADNKSTKYDNYRLVKLYPKNATQLEAIQKFFDPKDEYEVLKLSRGFNDSCDVLAPPHKEPTLKNFADQYEIEFEVKHNDYGRRINEVLFGNRRRSMRQDFFQSYHSYPEIQNYIEALVKAKPHFVQVETIGKSYEGRPLKIVKISKNPTAGSPVIFIEAGIHAREWVAPAMALYLIHRLTSDDHKQLNGLDWHIVPLSNPDGYEFTRTTDRMWRKTRSDSSYNSCKGVDGNRNYGFKWALSGVSNDPCNKETYAGPKPFSESETRAIRDSMMQVRDRMKLFLSLHSYGQYLVYPWGYTGESLPQNWKKLDKLARTVSNSVVSAGGAAFRVMSAGQWYPAAGGSDDFAFGVIGAPYSYTMELTDDYEFVFPQELLGDTLPKLYAGFKSFGNEIRKEFGNRRNRPRNAEVENKKDKLFNKTDEQ